MKKYYTGVIIVFLSFILLVILLSYLIQEHGLALIAAIGRAWRGE